MFRLEEILLRSDVGDKLCAGKDIEEEELECEELGTG